MLLGRHSKNFRRLLVLLGISLVLLALRLKAEYDSTRWWWTTKKNNRDPRHNVHLNPNPYQRHNVLLDVPESEKHDRWIVITSIAPPTEDVKFLANIPGWRVVVVGDTKTPDDWSYPNCVFLSVSTQELLGLQLPHLIPYKAYTRKNIGYLYAIGHGAKIIYETDDDNRPLDKLQSFIMTETTPGLLFAGQKLFNPYIHFGQSTLWPRGYPLSEIGSVQSIEYRVDKAWQTPLIQQGIVNGDPDMDAIFRLSRKKSTDNLNVTFDPHAPPVILPEGVFSPFNSQNTVFHYKAFWALLLPTTPTFRITDIWRGYWAQRLLWEIGGRLGFFPANAFQVRNAHNYLKDASEENDMYYSTEKLLDFLESWSCDNEKSFFGCVRDLTFRMSEEGFLGHEDNGVTDLWLKDLIELGYQEPKRVKVDLYEKIGYTGNNKLLASQWGKSVEKGSFATFVPVEYEAPGIGRETSKNNFYNQQLQNAAELCSMVKNITFETDVKTSGYFDDILMIINFNSVEWFSESVKGLEVAHRNMFPNILYCGEDENGSLLKEAMKTLRSNVSFISVPVHGNKRLGYKLYNCFLRATEMNYKVKDYFMVSDDSVLYTWNLHDLDRNKIWKFPVDMWNCKNASKWLLGKSEKHIFNGGMKTLKEKYGDANMVNNLTYNKFMYNLGNDTCMWAISDNYYIPKRYVAELAFMADFFSPYGLFMEILTPLLVHGIAPLSDILTFNVKDLYLSDRKTTWDFYSPATDHFLHPVKWSDKANVAAFCKYHLTHLLNYDRSRKKEFVYVGKKAGKTILKFHPEPKAMKEFKYV